MILNFFFPFPRKHEICGDIQPVRKMRAGLQPPHTYNRAHSTAWKGSVPEKTEKSPGTKCVPGDFWRRV